jgi:hypothetical protein
VARASPVGRTPPEDGATYRVRFRDFYCRGADAFVNMLHFDAEEVEYEVFRRRGEDVAGGLGKRLDIDAVLKAAGIGPALRARTVAAA